MGSVGRGFPTTFGLVIAAIIAAIAIQVFVLRDKHRLKSAPGSREDVSDAPSLGQRYGLHEETV
jgi:ACS family pantothenate transporter-like MFS transporter